MTAKSRWWTLAIGLAGGLSARAITRFVLEDVPHVMDEIAYTLQARTFALGHVTVPVRLPRAAFAMWFVDDRWATYSIFPPGWPALLAIGSKLHLEPWVNPFLHVLTTLSVAAIARRIGGERLRPIAAFTYAFSPQALVLAGSFMSHAAIAFGASLATLGALRISSRKSWPWWAVGAGVGLALVTRPLCAVAIAIAVAILIGRALVLRRWSLAGLARGCAAALAPVLVACALLGLYNHALTGHATRFPQSDWFDFHAPPVAGLEFFRYQPGCNDLGFGPRHSCDWSVRNATHDLQNALSNTGDNLTSWILLAWGGPLAILALGAAFVRTRGRARHLALAAPIPAVLGLYTLYWYAGTCYGARFYHAALPSVVVLAAWGAWWALRSRPLLIIGGFAWCLTSAVALAGAVGELRDNYWGTDGRYHALARTWKERTPALVLVAHGEDGFPMRPLTWTALGSRGKGARWLNNVRVLSALVESSPDLEGPIVFAKYHPALVDELTARYPNRERYLYIAHVDRARDRLLPFDASPARSVAPLSAPPDNFDGYVFDETGAGYMTVPERQR